MVDEHENIADESIKKGLSDNNNNNNNNNDAISDAIDKDIEISKNVEDEQLTGRGSSAQDFEDAMDRVLGGLSEQGPHDHDNIDVNDDGSNNKVSESHEQNHGQDHDVLKEINDVLDHENAQGSNIENENQEQNIEKQDEATKESTNEVHNPNEKSQDDSLPDQEPKEKSNELQEQEQEKHKGQPQDQSQEQIQEQSQEQSQGQSQEQSQEQPQEQNQDKEDQVQNKQQQQSTTQDDLAHKESPKDKEQEPKENQQYSESSIEPSLQSPHSIDTIIRNGVPIPKDSALLTPLQISYNPLQEDEVSSDVLVKANLASLPLSLQAHESLSIRVQFLIHSVPLLDNIATQILRIIGVGPYEETLAIITAEEPTPEGLVYKDLVELFEQVKRIFSEEDPFLSFHNIIEDLNELSLDVVKSLRNLEDQLDSAFRKANLASFLLATLGSIEVGFFYLNESFLDVFCPTYNNGWTKNPNSTYHQHLNSTTSITAGKLLKAQAALFLELKTQAYISALESGDRSKEEVLDDIFPDFLKDQLLHRRQTTELTPAEQDFLQRCKSRRETLFSTPDDQDLAEHYEWLIFLKELFNYVSKNIGFLIWGRKGRHQELTTIGFDSSGSSTPITAFASFSKEELQRKLEEQRLKEREAKERAEKQDREKLPTARQLNKKNQLQKSTTGSNSSGNTSRQNKSTAARNPPRLRHILRRPWTGEEEEALIDALKLIGPQWSKILELHGAGGSKSEALKNRTQVQLKDKARNWKMGYLKNKGEAPDYLSKVTGDLGDDRSTKKRRRDNTNAKNATNSAAAQSGAPPSLTGNKKARATAKSITSDNNLSNQEIQSSTSETNRVSQQESSVRLEKPDDQSSDKTTDKETNTSQDPITSEKGPDGDVSMQE
ncbi:hypothetical protein BN7_5968 [Wickerhamomyces ciferrii]|uniref:Uncharacterized protein n=1 Tax=Wickerhamomyces ciferrii (strain ATCC 14091 / BCRC 22168 / CBS 111 / JCM 3599 / NBRC 0793 / NRRL Y-1031 F-60-10) TaxID=1206466 RepID=K0KM94_WICCF|nr:uncharacterized protein BN7_5968 [Wickerhamomyces ciferrii]CCH46375.1 hypothetical protein BN7_5968 [Wickerhamomyces ciferrii]